MKKCIFLALIFTTSVTLAQAQSIPTLAKEWGGTITVSSVGTPIKHQPGHEDNVGKENAAKGINFFTDQRTLTLIRQQGRHVEFVHSSGRFSNPEVGVISADGKQLMIIAEGYSTLMNIDGNKLSGCGTTRGNNGTFEHHQNNYSAWCYEFTAKK